ncbi:MAG: hypothetical protein AAGC63_00285, partial [Propionicimonas sp.]
AGSTALRVGLLAGSSIPAAMDTEAEIQDLATVDALLALTGVDEPTASWYTGAGTAGRLNLSRTNATQDDTNNRVNMDAANLTWSAAAVGTTIYGAFVYDATTDTSDTTRQLISVITLPTPIPTNGSDLVLQINDLFRAS